MIQMQTALVRLGLAALLGACIGATRVSRLPSAWIGVQALGSCLLTTTALIGFTGAPVIGQVQGDPTRIVSWILLGSGLPGMGSPFAWQGRPTVATLATAATFWVAAVIGVLCGAGRLSAAVWGSASDTEHRAFLPPGEAILPLALLSLHTW